MADDDVGLDDVNTPSTSTVRTTEENVGLGNVVLGTPLILIGRSLTDYDDDDDNDEQLTINNVEVVFDVADAEENARQYAANYVANHLVTGKV